MSLQTLRAHPCLATLFVCLLQATRCQAQALSTAEGRVGTADSPEAPAPAEKPPVAVIEKQPSFFYIPDQSGQLRPVINLPLNLLERLLQLDRGREAEQRPKYAIELKAQGECDRKVAKLHLKFEIRLFQEGWIKVPLRLDEAILLPNEIKHDGPGEALLAPDESGRGYVCWLRGKEDKPHQLQATALVPIEEIGDEKRFRLATPLALSSSLELSIAGSGLIARVPADDVLESAKGASGNATVFKVTAARSPLELIWWQQTASHEDASPALEASAVILAEVSGRHLQETALISVRSLEQPFSRFHVRLPAGAVLKSGTGTNYSAAEAPTNPNPDTVSAGTVYAVQLDQPVRQADIRLVAECPEFTEEKLLQFAGFDVLEARRQSGHLGITIVGDWQLIWGDHQNVHRVPDSQMPVELRRQGTTHSFQYVAQPCSLTARVVQRQARTIVEPSFIFRVQKQQDELEAQFRWRATSARVSEVKLNWADSNWQIDEVGPANLVDVDQLELTQCDPLVIPLSQPTLGDFEITVKAHRPRAAEQQTTSLAGPIPVADGYKPALFVIAPADNISLLPRAEELVGLSRQSSALAKGLANQQQEPLCYRADTAQHFFVGDLQVLSRRIDVAAWGTVSWSNRWIVEQRFQFQIANEPASSLAFDVPAAVAANPTLSMTMDGQKLSPSMISIRSAGEKGSALHVSLPTPRIGACEIGFAFSLAMPAARETKFDIPLITAKDARLTSNQIILPPTGGIEVENASNSWAKVGSGDELDSATSGLLLERADAAASLPLKLRLLDVPITQPLVVERAWTQTWLSDRERQDRAVFRLVTERDRMTLRLPADAAAASVQVFLDGKRIAARVRDRRQLVILLDAERPPAERVLEVLYRCPMPAFWTPWLSFEPAVILGADTTRFSYWQLLMPQRRFLLLTPGDFSAEYTWDWNGLFFKRRPMLEQADLEIWSGARAERVAAVPTNRYLLGALGAPPELSILVLDRSMLVLIGSGGFLMIGLLLLQAPKTRHPAILLVLAVVIAGAALLEPDLAILILQASIVGAVLVCLAAFLKWFLARRRGPRFVVQRTPSSLVERGSSRTQPHAIAAAGSGSSTKATPQFELAQDSHQ